MRSKKAIVPAADLPCCATACALRAWLCGVLVLVALSACGSVQTTTSGDPSSSLPQSVSDPQRPVITGNPPTSAQVGVPYDYTPTVSDTLSTALTFSITNMPGWATFNTATGELKGTPGADDVGTTNEIEISVSDSVGVATVGPFRITVTAAQSTPPSTTPPTITGTPAASVVAGQAYSFAPSASDLSGNALTFLIVNRPSWASFSTSTGRLTGTPAAANIGSYANILISVSDGTLTASLPAFTITVTQPSGDGPPTISGTPAIAVNADSAYSFTPTATDPGGNALTFSIQNQPSWANFSTTTGQLSGTPTATNVGSYPNILISVSDGTLSASLAAFGITVSQPSTNTVTVNWSVPTQNTNGTPLVNLAGYSIYYGTSPNNLNQSAQVTNPGVTSYVLTNLAPGTWYFEVADYTTSGVESSMSNIASTTVP